jgi:hypothetical protein
LSIKKNRNPKTMESFEFIVKELELFVKDFPKTRVRYEDDKMTKAHFIEIVPNETYKIEEKYIKWERDLFKRFIEKYPYENICFISDDAVAGLDEVHHTFFGSEFEGYSLNVEKIVIFNEIELKQILIEKVVSKNDGLWQYYDDFKQKDDGFNQKFAGQVFESSLTYQIAA